MQSFLSLSIVFVAWKILILLTAFCAPGLGYDTSTSLLTGANKLVRWDAIYFVQIARRGHVFEQEWAFGKGVSTLLSTVSNHDTGSITRTGILLAHVAHYLSVLLVWQIAEVLCHKGQHGVHRRSIPTVAACLHIISPAGIFLSAPYAESFFSCLNMFGIWLYLLASRSSISLLFQSSLLITSGLSLGCATLMRSNGILSGLPFLLDAAALSRIIVKNLLQGVLRRSHFQLLLATTIGGLGIAIGLVLPQYIAWHEYCAIRQDSRPWCLKKLPLIYSFVQSHYWGVGFLRYWTVSNLPLFLLALPSLVLLLQSGFDGLFFSASADRMPLFKVDLVRRIAAPQVVLAILAITNYHVQIITRLSSGYPWLYIWLASKICSKSRVSGPSIRLFVMYGLIQAGLFASFLPPA